MTGAARLLPILAVTALACTQSGENYQYEDELDSLDPMPEARFGATATSLEDGRVAIVGGLIGPPSQLGADAFVAEVGLFDPATEELTRGASMAQPRNEHTTTRLADGRLMIVGGTTLLELGLTGRALDIEVYDPADDSFSTIGELPSGMFGHCAAALPDGKVLALDECDSIACSPVIIDPAGSVEVATPELPPSFRYATDIACVTLDSGGVLLAGGQEQDSQGADAIEIYDPTRDSFDRHGGMAARRNEDAKVSLLDNGDVLIVGGATGDEPIAEIYEADSNSFRSVSGGSAHRSDHSLTRLGDGRVLIAGGSTEIDGSIVYVSTLEVYDPQTDSLSALPDELPGRRGHAVPGDASAAVLIAGGKDSVGNLADVYLLR